MTARQDNGTERTLGQLVADATTDLSSIVRSEIALAKAEVTEGAKVAGMGAGLLGGAAFVALLGLIFLFNALAWGIAELIGSVWAGYLITAGLLLVLAAILGVVGKGALSKAKPKPERAIRNAQETISTLKSDS